MNLLDGTRVGVRASILSNTNISETSGPNAIKICLNHHWVGGKAEICFGPNRIRILISMTTDSPNYKGENVVNT